MKFHRSTHCYTVSLRTKESNGSQRRARAITSASIALLALAACSTDRYAGTLGRDLTYSNRGYGLALRIPEMVRGRWEVLDPTAEGPKPPRTPVMLIEPLDLNGDGTLEFAERTRYFRPTLRMVSRTSTAAALEIDVRILQDASTVFGLARRQAHERDAQLEPAPVAGGKKRSESGIRYELFEARIPGRALRLAVIDQPRFVAEGGVIRRQGVTVILDQNELTEDAIADQNALLNSLYLNAVAGDTTHREEW